MPWSYPDDVPAVAQNWTEDEQRRCVAAANETLEETGDEEQAIYACIGAAGKAGKVENKIFRIANFKALDEQKGIFEAIVAVFNNVDRIGDKIIPGAFAGSLARWQEKERPIPVIFAHEWDNLDAHIGSVIEAKEVEEGLYVKGQLEMDEPFAKRVWKKMRQGVLAEFSFAFDTLKQVVTDGVRELREVELLEVGPCLVGMNPDTRLIGVKAGARHTGKEFEAIQQIHDLAIQLGAKCAGQDDSDGEDEADGQDEARSGKSRSREASILAARMAAELVELE